MIVNRTRGQWHWENPASVEMILGILVDVMEVFAPRIPRDERLTRNDIFERSAVGTKAWHSSEWRLEDGRDTWDWFVWQKGGADGTAPGNKQARYFCNIL